MSREHLVVLVLSVALAPSATSACESAGPATAIEAVRAERAAFNAAIKKKDIEAVAATIRESVVLVTGTTNAVISGRAAQVSLWQGNFSTPGRAERPGAESFAAGTYAAKWRRVDGTWLLEAEIFATEACGGDLCPVDDGGANLQDRLR